MWTKNKTIIHPIRKIMALFLVIVYLFVTFGYHMPVQASNDPPVYYWVNNEAWGELYCTASNVDYSTNTDGYFSVRLGAKPTVKYRCDEDQYEFVKWIYSDASDVTYLYPDEENTYIKAVEEGQYVESSHGRKNIVMVP